jgi:uncharacterized protein
MPPPSTATLPRMRAAPRPTCPICGRAVPLPADASSATAPPGGAAPFPFCSAACKLVDLGRWLDGAYRIPGPPVESSLDGGRDGDDE